MARLSRSGLPVALALGLATSFLTTAAGAETAKPADDFVAAIGTNVHFLYSNYIDNFDTVVVPRLKEIGIRNIRDGILLDDEPFNQRIRAVGAVGVKGTFITRPKQFPALVDWAKGMAPYIDTLEGPNEPHNEPESYKGFAPMASLKPYQQDLYAAVRAEPLLADVKVATPGIDWFPAYSSVGDLDQWADYGNFHHWPPSTGEVPYKGTAPTDGLYKGRDGKEASGLLMMARTIASTKPLITTETGWSTTQVTPTAGGGWDPGVSEAAAARYATRVMLELFNNGVRKAFIYELLDEPTTQDPVKQHQGMLTIDGALKPHAVALKNLIGLLSDQGAAFSAGSLDFTLTSQGASLVDDHDYKTADIHHLLLQKRNGGFYLVIWNEAVSYDNQTEKDIAIAEQQVTLSLKAPIERARTFRPLAGAEAVATFQNPTELTLQVPDHPLVVELNPPGTTEVVGGAGGAAGAGASAGGAASGGTATAAGGASSAGAVTMAGGVVTMLPGGGAMPTTVTGGAAGAAVAGTNGTPTPADPAGCGCVLASSSNSTSRGGLWAPGLAALLCLRRLRRGD